MKELEEACRRVRINILRMIERAGSGHPGGSLSCVEILVSLYFHQMKDDDIFVLSKGHAAPALYAVLAEKGFIPEEELRTLRKLGSRLQGHTSSHYLPFIRFSAGMLGQGLSFTNGMACRSKMNRSPRHHYVLLSEGDMQYGQTWSAAMTASHRKLDNVCAIADCNGLQIDGRVEDVKNIEPLQDKWKAFGWIVFGCDGHNLRDLTDALGHAQRVAKGAGAPAIVIAKTIKGKGVSFMEDNNEFHGKPPTRKELETALKELGGEPWKD